jgi:hypothetical protein
MTQIAKTEQKLFRNIEVVIAAADALKAIDKMKSNLPKPTPYAVLQMLHAAIDAAARNMIESIDMVSDADCDQLDDRITDGRFADPLWGDQGFTKTAMAIANIVLEHSAPKTDRELAVRDGAIRRLLLGNEYCDAEATAEGVPVTDFSTAY